MVGQVMSHSALARATGATEPVRRLPIGPRNVFIAPRPFPSRSICTSSYKSRRNGSTLITSSNLFCQTSPRPNNVPAYSEESISLNEPTSLRLMISPKSTHSPGDAIQQLSTKHRADLSFSNEARHTMKAGIFITGSGPILILTSFNSLSNPLLIKKLQSKGIRKFIAYEIPEETARERYGSHFDLTLSDLKQDDDLRVLDYDGHHIFKEFSLKELGQPVFFEP